MVNNNHTNYILLVSKYPYQLDIFREGLNDADYNLNYGWEVITAETGSQAVDQLNQKGISDISLIVMGSNGERGFPKPKINGGLPEAKELEDYIVGLGTDAPPVIIHTAYTNAEELYRGSEIEPFIIAYVTKSQNPSGFVEAVRGVIGPAEKTIDSA